MSQNVGVSGEESSDSMVQVHSLRHDTLERGWEGRGREGRGREGGEERSWVMRISTCMFYNCGLWVIYTYSVQDSPPTQFSKYLSEHLQLLQNCLLSVRGHGRENAL